MIRLRLVLVALTSIALAACGHSGDAAPTPAVVPTPGATPAPTPTPAPPPTPAPGPSLAAGSARAALIAALANGRARKMRMRTQMTTVASPAAPPRVISMVVESVPPDRQRMQMQASPTVQTETVRIGTRAWMRLNGGARWIPAPPVSVAVGTASASSMIEESSRALESGELTAERVGEEAGMTIYHLTGSIGGRGTVDTRVWIGADGLPQRYGGRTTQTNGSTADITATIEYDDRIAIEPPTP